MSKITMPFFQATSNVLPLTKEVANVQGGNLPSAGPYYMTRNDVDTLTSIRKNPNYKVGPRPSLARATSRASTSSGT